jgi:hypothetical protein
VLIEVNVLTSASSGLKRRSRRRSFMGKLKLMSKQIRLLNQMFPESVSTYLVFDEFTVMTEFSRLNQTKEKNIVRSVCGIALIGLGKNE